jgi:hypothetical protein
MFNFTGSSMWPLCYSIMNFPPSLRDKPHVGECFICPYAHICRITSKYVVRYYVELR